MIKFIALVILILTAGYLFSPYLISLVNYFGYGLNHLSNLLNITGQIISYFLNCISNFHYIFLLISIFIFLKVLFYVIDSFGGQND